MAAISSLDSPGEIREAVVLTEVGAVGAVGVVA